MDLFSVDQVAEILGMHPRTVRRLLREGKLTGTKVGGEWRITAESLKRHLTPEHVEKAATDLLEAGPAGSLLRSGDAMAACAVVDLQVASPEAVAPLTSRVLDLINRAPSQGGPLKFTYYYDQEAGKARFTFWGHPGFVGQLLSAMAQRIPEGEESA
ncbi:MAG TPA: helix-turn-helix domain-containing protein [Symbiobacteriaceae bacterium]|jgi:excisionase family DNA binding protein|nr:helix-turn-helix domain-containing protein [Symbiobacteriaceae bacterium]